MQALVYLLDLNPVELVLPHLSHHLMQKATFTGNITNTKLVSGTKAYDEFLSVTVAVNDRNKNSIRIKYTDSNGLLKAFRTSITTCF